MSGFVDATDPRAVEEVLRAALPGMGIGGLAASLQSLPGVAVRSGRARGLLRAAEPTVIGEGDEQIALTPGADAVRNHVVGGVILSREVLAPPAVPAVLARLVVRAVLRHDSADAAAVLLTSIRDALAAGGGGR